MKVWALNLSKPWETDAYQKKSVKYVQVFWLSLIRKIGIGLFTQCGDAETITPATSSGRQSNWEHCVLKMEMGLGFFLGFYQVAHMLL